MKGLWVPVGVAGFLFLFCGCIMSPKVMVAKPLTIEIKNSTILVVPDIDTDICLPPPGPAPVRL